MIRLNEVSKARWRAAQEQEKKYIESTDDMREWLLVRRHTWRSVLDLLKGEIVLSNSKRILDIGSGPTSIFFALRARALFKSRARGETMMCYALVRMHVMKRVER